MRIESADNESCAASIIKNAEWKGNITDNHTVLINYIHHFVRHYNFDRNLIKVG